MGNCIALCASCHQKFTANPLDFDEWVHSYLGNGHMEMLKERRRQILKTNVGLRKEISDHYRKEYKQAQIDPNYIIIGW